MLRHAWSSARRQTHLSLRGQVGLVWDWLRGRREGPFCSVDNCDLPVVPATRLCSNHQHRAATPAEIDAAVRAAGVEL